MARNLADDENQHAQRVAERLDAIVENRDLAALFAELRPYYKQVSASAAGMSVVTSEGRTTTAEETMTAFANMFADMLSDKKVTKEDLVASVLAKGPCCGDVSDKPPTLAETVRLYASYRPLVGLGIDLLGSELFKAPRHMAEIVYPVLRKAWLRAEPPLQWRGGVMFPLHKKGGRDNATNYRDITCGAASAKTLASPLRKRLLPLLQSVVSAGQAGGGVQGGGTDFACLYLMAVLNAAQQQNLSVVLCFADLASAFASICRRLFFPAPDSLEEVAHRFQALGFSPVDAAAAIGPTGACGVAAHRW